MGEKIKLLWPELEFELPNRPVKETDYLFHEFKTADQFWRNPRIPSANEWDKISAEKRFLLVERERERRKNGVWCLINGVETFITGKHYDHMVYSTFDYKVGYLDAQRHDWYFRELVKNDPYSYGGLVIKPRRFGFTDEEVTDNTCEAIEDEFRSIGMMSDTREKVYSTLYDKITASYIQRPKFVRPEVLMRNGLIPRKKMLFQSGKVSKKASENALNFGLDLSLNSKIVPKSTTVMGYDGDKLHKLTLDEIWKWTKVSPKACWAKQKKTLFSGGKIIGYAMLLSTMGDDEDYEDAIREGIEMWHDSNPCERDKNGFTKTGLYRYFVPGYHALFDPALGYVNKYGVVDEDRATQYILNEREKYTPGSLDWTFEVRRYPLNVEEALESALTKGVFDKARISERITIIKKMSDKDKPYSEGKLVEDNNKKVHFVPDKNEPWLFAKHPYISKEKNIDKSNRFRYFDNRYFAPRNPEGALGYDPVRYLQSDTTSNSISNASITGIYKFDYFRQPWESAAGHRACLYLHRPEDPEEAHYECIKAAKYLGFLVQFERQVESFIRLCREIQFTDFLLKGGDGKFGLWTDNNKKVLKNGTDRIQGRWKTPKDIIGRDYLMEEPFIEALEQGRDFDPKKTTKFDFIMSDIMCHDGLLQIMESTQNDDHDMEKAMNALVKQLFPKRQ